MPTAEGGLIGSFGDRRPVVAAAARAVGGARYVRGIATGKLGVQLWRDKLQKSEHLLQVPVSACPCLASASHDRAVTWEGAPQPPVWGQTHGGARGGCWAVEELFLSVGEAAVCLVGAVW